MTDEFLVNATTVGSQRMPSAVATADGGYIITGKRKQGDLSAPL